MDAVAVVARASSRTVLPNVRAHLAAMDVGARGPRHLVWVVDGTCSRGPADLLDGACGVHAHVVDRARARALAERWGRALSPPAREGLRCLLGVDLPEGEAVRTGAARNVALLVCDAMRLDRALYLDDDVSLTGVSTRAEGAAHRVDEGAWEHIAYPSVGEALESAVDEERAYLPEAHAEWLGRDIPGVGRVALSLSGVLGDSGVEAPFWRIVSGDLEECAPEDYLRLRDSRGALVAVDAVTVLRRGRAPGAAFGVDHRARIGLFPPLGRGQVAWFARLTRGQTGQSCIALPVCAIHVPDPTPRNLGLDETVRARFSDVLSVLLGDVDGADVDVLLRASRYSEQEWRQRVGGRLQVGLAHAAARARAASRDAHPLRRSDLAAIAGALERAREADGIPVDLVPPEHGASEALRVTQSVLHGLARALEHWPAIRRTVREVGLER